MYQNLCKQETEFSVIAVSFVCPHQPAFYSKFGKFHDICIKKFYEVSKLFPVLY